MLRQNLTVRVLGIGLLTALLFPLASSRAAAEEPVPNLKLEESTAVTLDKDRNGMAAKTRLIATPSFIMYSLNPVVDGIKERTELGWQECSWASEEDPLPHGIEIRLSKPVQGGRFQVAWAFDVPTGKWWISRNYCIQIKAKADAPWKTVITVKNNQSVVGSYPLPDEAFSFLRIVQLPSGGPTDRPDIMWVGQVEFTR